MTIRLPLTAIAAAVFSFASEDSPKPIPEAMRQALQRIDLMRVQSNPLVRSQVHAVAPVGKCAIRLREFSGAPEVKMPEYRAGTRSNMPTVVPVEPCPDEEKETLARRAPKELIR